MKKKGFIMGDMLGWWIIGAAVLVLMLFIYLILNNKGVGAIEYLKRLLRFG